VERFVEQESLKPGVKEGMTDVMATQRIKAIMPHKLAIYVTVSGTSDWCFSLSLNYSYIVIISFIPDSFSYYQCSFSPVLVSVKFQILVIVLQVFVRVKVLVTVSK